MITRVSILNNKKQISRKRKLIIVLISTFIISIVSMLLLLITPQGNTIIHTINPNLNTPVDSLVKTELNKKINNSNLTDTNKEKLTSMLQTLPVSTFTKAAEDPATAATLLSKYTNKDKYTSRDIVDAIYANSDLKKIREDIAQNNWLGAANQYNKLKSNGTINNAIVEAQNKNNETAKQMQSSASKLYNEAISKQPTN